MYLGLKLTVFIFFGTVMFLGSDVGFLFQVRVVFSYSLQIKSSAPEFLFSPPGTVI